MPARRLRLLVAVDFSPESARALKVARDLGRRCGGRLTLVHVRPPSDVRAAVVEERGDLLGLKGAALRRALEAHYQQRFERFVGSRRREDWKVLTGRAADAIRREARRGYNLIVIGERGAGGVPSVLLGSTVQDLLRSSPLPLVVVPSR